MEYDAITFDTQTVETNGFHFDGGMLAQLKQFKNGPIIVIVSEIVSKEILKHLVEKTRSAKDGLESALKKASECGLVSSAKPQFVEEPIDIRILSKKRLEAFLNAIGAIGVGADNVNIRQLIDRYFAPLPPFSASGKKKNEFPDAISLLSLEHWAKTEKKKILAVSGDKDWVAFCEKSIHIDAVADLEDALERLQEHSVEASETAEKLLRGIADKSKIDLHTDLYTQLENEVSGIAVYGEADSTYHAEADQVDLTFLSMYFVGEPDDLDFTVVQAGPGKIVVRVESILKIRAEASFSLSIYDSIDKDYVGMGSAEAEREEEIEVGLLLTFEGNFDDDDVILSAVEVVDAPSSIDFGYVEPDYSDDYYDSELEYETAPDSAATDADKPDSPF